MTVRRYLRWSALWCGWGCLLLGAVAKGDDASFRLSADVVVRFAKVEEGREALAAEDAFLRGLGTLELQLRLATEKEVDREQYVKFLTAEVLPWPEEQQDKVKAVLRDLQQRMKGLEIPLPREVLLIHTSGKEETNAAYTRGNSIALPSRRLNVRNSSLQRLIAHELFHVLSRHNAELRKTLYQLLGFQPCGGVILPDALKQRQILNPDAPTYDYCIAIEHEGETFDAIPILLASSDSYRDLAGQPIFKAMRFRLWLGHLTDEGWMPAVTADGDLRHIDGRKSESYRKQIGGNTNYIIHPDEVLADNFVHLLMGTPDLPNPEIVAAMRRELTRSSAQSD